MPSSAMLIRKQARQPQARKASSGSSPGQGEGAGGQHEPAGYADVGEAAVEAAALGGGVLHGEQHGAAVLAAHADALQHPQQHERDRRPDADLVVGRQQADERGADAHDDQGQQEHLLAPDAVAVVAEDQAADRSGEEPDGEGGEGRELRGRSVQAVEVELVEDHRGGRAVEEEVVPLDRGADGRGERDAARGRGTSAIAPVCLPLTPRPPRRRGTRSRSRPRGHPGRPRRR